MGDGPYARLRSLGLELPPPFAPVATYQPAVLSGGRLYVSGQGPVWGKDIRYRGRLGREIGLDEARAAARLTMLNVLAHVENAVGLDRVEMALQVFGLVNAAPGASDAHDIVAEGAALLDEVFGETGRCTVSCIAASSLPFEIAVEMDAVFAIT